MPTRVLVIDDDPQTHAFVAAVLEAAGYVVRGVESGAAGVELAETEPPDLILLDLQMPGMDGYEVCRILRQRPSTRQIPVVMITSSDDLGLNRTAYAAGAQACVPKPLRREGLIAMIETVLAGMPRMAPPAAERTGPLD